jgi:mono/diheme cytochrome c family protein
LFRSTSIIAALFVLLLTACNNSNSIQSAKDLPTGDPARGAAMFAQSLNGAPTCSSCHMLDDKTVVGPGLKGYSAAAGTRDSNLSAAEYTFQSISQPALYLVSGYGNLMYNQYAQRLNAQQIADLIAFLLTL